MKWMAELRGGPCDGQSAEIVGPCFKKRFGRLRKGNLSLWDALYIWEETREGTFIGRFAGYFDDHGRVDCLGRRISKRRPTKKDGVRKP